MHVGVLGFHPRDDRGEACFVLGHGHVLMGRLHDGVIRTEPDGREEGALINQGEDEVRELELGVSVSV